MCARLSPVFGPATDELRRAGRLLNFHDDSYCEPKEPVVEEEIPRTPKLAGAGGFWDVVLANPVIEIDRTRRALRLLRLRRVSRSGGAVFSRRAVWLRAHLGAGAPPSASHAERARASGHAARRTRQGPRRRRAQPRTAEPSRRRASTEQRARTEHEQSNARAPSATARAPSTDASRATRVSNRAAREHRAPSNARAP